MTETPIHIEYNQDMARLSELLGQVDRAGSFVTSGLWTGVLPRVDVDGVGTVAFPLLEVQSEAIAGVCEQAPYGRGEETLYDASVRSTWQLGPAGFSVGGGSWSDTLAEIMRRVQVGLGCENLDVKAELYKLLLYREGDFFAPHRDTEKADGMFATLVIALPSFYEGGRLIVQHGGHAEEISMAAAEVSELHYAAFYADCMHEVLPVTRGSRACLVYNLIHGPGIAAPGARPAAPDYDHVVDKVSAELVQWKNSQGAANKAAWLLDHVYTPDGLSFSGLKHVDAARADVLRRATEAAGCALYLGMVHIGETGPAQIEYSGYERRGRRGYSYYDDDDSDVSDEDYEVVEVSDWWHTITDWVTPDDATVDFGELPLLPGELLPVGALDGEPPDEERVHEATGNEGASFERSYRRAVLVFWGRDKTAEVLLHAGTAAAVAHLGEDLAQADLKDSTQRAALVTAAEGVTRNWDDAREANWRARTRGSGMGAMLELLASLGDEPAIRLFVEDVVLNGYEHGINDPLVACLRLVSPQESGRLAAELVTCHAEVCTADCIDLLAKLVPAVRDNSILERIAGELIAVLPREHHDEGESFWLSVEQRPTALSGGSLAELFDALRSIGSARLVSEALAVVTGCPEVYPPDTMTVPALRDLHGRFRRGVETDASYAGLWCSAVDCLLARSDRPPADPRDWAQPVKDGCTCGDCRALLRFVQDPEAQTCRFPLNKGRRLHLHRRIDGDGMDMTHETERRGRPYTLVCTKTRASHKRRLAQYDDDIDAMRFLSRHPPADPGTRLGQLKSALGACADAT